MSPLLIDTQIFIKEFILKHLNILCCTECDYLQKFLEAILAEESVSCRVSEGENWGFLFSCTTLNAPCQQILCPSLLVLLTQLSAKWGLSFFSVIVV
jgi:hypothetical protein